MASTRPEAAASGPVLFAYDGSELAQLAIEQAGHATRARPRRTRPLRLATGRRRIRTRRRRNTSTPRTPPRCRSAARADRRPRSRAGREGRVPAAEHRQSRPRRPGKASSKTAEEREASLIVLGSHRRSGLVGHLLGSVAAAVVTHSTILRARRSQRSRNSDFRSVDRCLERRARSDACGAVFVERNRDVLVARRRQASCHPANLTDRSKLSRSHHDAERPGSQRFPVGHGSVTTT